MVRIEQDFLTGRICSEDGKDWSYDAVKYCEVFIPVVEWCKFEINHWNC